MTADYRINIIRVKTRQAAGGHNVPEDKIVNRYHRSLDLLPYFINVCDICHVYDNSDEPFRIFKKRKEQQFIWENEFWNKETITELLRL